MKMMKTFLILEIIEVVLVHCNIVKKDYQCDLRVLEYTLVSNKSFGQLLDISPKKILFLKTFNSEFCYIEVRFTDQNSTPLEIEDKINITLIITKNDALFSSTKRSSICKRLHIFVFC